MKLLLSFILLLCSAINAVAQYDNIWAFGYGAGIDFNSNPPRAIKTSIRTNEGCASISNDKGQLLFYTDGTTIWDNNNTPMPNGRDLTGSGENVTWSTSQAAVIVPMPGQRKKYYVFSLGSAEYNKYGWLYYCIVDMALNGGKGDVVTGMKSKLLATGLEEVMTAVPGDQCNIWLIVTSRRQIKSYNIGSGSIDTIPVVSPKIGLNYVVSAGCIDVSPNRSRLALGQVMFGDLGSLVLYEFDPATGIAGNALVLDKANGHYGVSFSSDNSKLYGTKIGREDAILQYDLSLSNAQNIVVSRIDIGSSGGWRTIRRAMDGRMYINNLRYLSVINHPNLPGTACEYVDSGFYLEDQTLCILGFPNPSTTFGDNQIYNATTDTAYCADSFLLVAKDTTGSDYKWEDGIAGVSRYIYQSGIYTLHYHLWDGNNCGDHIEEFFITLYNIPKHYTTTAFSGRCQADTFTMIANNLNQSRYLWEDGITTGKTRKINKTGIYWVSYPSDSLCEHYIDSFFVTYPAQDYKVSFTVDTLVCENDLLEFQNTSDPHFNSFTWSFGNGDSSFESPQYSYREAGNYEVRLVGEIDGICPDTAYQTITVDAPLPVSFTVTPDSICAGSPLYFHHKLTDSIISSLHWNFGDGVALYTADNRLQHAYDKAGVLPVTLSAQFRACPSDTFTHTIHVFDLPLVNLGADTGLCFSSSPLYLKNLVTDTAAIFHHLWSTGDTMKSIAVRHPGMYSLTVVKEPAGCTTTDKVEVKKDCYIDIQNAFTPNNDGRNDYFFPRQYLSHGVIQFKMQILNRWGQLIFETTNIDGRGWDGKYNGQLQPQGVYIYSLVVETADGRKEHYRGNVTLVR